MHHSKIVCPISRYDYSHLAHISKPVYIIRLDKRNDKLYVRETVIAEVRFKKKSKAGSDCVATLIDWLGIRFVEPIVFYDKSDAEWYLANREAVIRRNLDQCQ